jgi:hypothetical protein
MVLRKYSNQGLAGFVQNPNDDRKAAISAMMEKAFVFCFQSKSVLFRLNFCV